ncbi:TPA: hypothetical protein ACGIK9_002848 [Acinetobacter baumannii]|uniref:hypothetical protein n=1 Tax=Acinetobacter baumannii TaxID=470 RepID=UPI0033901F44
MEKVSYLEKLREITNPLFGKTQFSVQNDVAVFLNTVNKHETQEPFDINGIVLDGKPGCGKTEILEKVVLDKTKIIYPDSTNVEEIFNANSDMFIALDEGKAFDEEQLIEYLEKIKDNGKSFILSVQNFDSLPVGVKEKIKTGFKNVEIINF